MMSSRPETVVCRFRFPFVLEFLVILVTLSPAPPAWSQDEPGVDPELQKRGEKIDASMPLWMDKAEVPGLSLAGVWGGDYVGAAAWGVGNTMLGTPVDETTVFAAASLTKPVVAWVVLQLVDEGVLQLDQPLADILLLPELADDPRAREITVRMILSHTSGLPNWRWDRPLELQFEPGTKFQYSGEGFVWLARVVEEVTGRSLEDLVQARVFGPLGMKSSSLVWQEHFAKDFAVGHNEYGEARDPDMTSEANAASSMRTTARDYALFLQAVLSGDALSEPLRKQLFKPQVEVAPGVAWGLGWGLQETGGGRAIFQWGDNPGYKAFVTADVASRNGIVVLTNSDNGMALMNETVRTAMGEDQPVFEWLGYESFNSPARQVRHILERVLENEGTQATLDEYHSLKRRYPQDAFREGLLNGLGYSLMQQERWQEAIQLFTLNVEEYPDAYNPYDSLGEAYMRAGDVERAIENYERSVEINPDNQNGIDILAELRKRLE